MRWRDWVSRGGDSRFSLRAKAFRLPGKQLRMGAMVKLSGFEQGEGRPTAAKSNLGDAFGGGWRRGDRKSVV